MPTLDEILGLKDEKSSINLVPVSNVNPLTQEELEARKQGIDYNATATPGITFEGNTGVKKESINADNITNDYLSKALKTPGLGNNMDSLLNATMKQKIKLPSEEESAIKVNNADDLARYEFPVYADIDDPELLERTAYNMQTNMDAMIKGAKNIVPVAIGVGAQMLGGTLQIGNNLLGDDDYDNPITKWGRDYMKKNMNPIYHAGEGETFSSPKAVIAAGSEIIGQFGSAIGSMVGMSPLNSAMVRSSIGIGTAIGGPIGGMIGSIAGIIGAAAVNAYAEGAIDAADVHDEKYAQLMKMTNNEEYSKKTAQLAASTVAGQNMMLNTALNIIPVIWSTKPSGVDKYIKNALGLDDVEPKWFNLHKPYTPQKLATETFQQYEDRLVGIVGSGMANNMQYSMMARPLEAIKNLGGYAAQKKNAAIYNFKHPVELLRRNWDIIGETMGEGLEEYHNYFAREQGMKVFNEDDAGWLPSLPKLVKGYHDLITEGEGAYDLVAGALIGGMTAPLLSNVRFGRSKVYNPHTGQMEYKYDRNKLVDWIPFEFNKDFDKHDYNQHVINSLNTIKDSKELANSYITTDNKEDKEKIINQLLAAPLTNYIDNNSYDAYVLSMEAFASKLGELNFDQDEQLATGHLEGGEKLQYSNLLTERDRLMTQTDPGAVAKLAAVTNTLKTLKDKAKSSVNNHSQNLRNRVDFLKKSGEDYKKVKQEVESNYGNSDYGYANALFKNKMGLELEQSINKNATDNYNTALNNLKNKLHADNPTANSIELANIFEKTVTGNDPRYADLIDTWVKTKKRKYDSTLRLNRFSHRYNSLNSWGYENEADLKQELELLEDLNDLEFTEDDIKILGEKDELMKQSAYYQSLIDNGEAMLALETDSIKKIQIQGQIDVLKSFINTDPVANTAYAKYLRFLDLSNQLSEVYKKQVSNQQNFKGNENQFKDFNPFKKYLKRNEMLAAELKKMSQAKTNIEAIQKDILAPYEQYAAIYEDTLLEGERVNIFNNIMVDYQKLIYDKALKKFDDTDYTTYNNWLKGHDIKYNEVLNQLKATVFKYTSPGTENKTLAKYASKMIDLMRYQKDVIDQLKIIRDQQVIQIVNSNIDETIELLNKGVIDIDAAIANISRNVVLGDDEKKKFLEALELFRNKTDGVVTYEMSVSENSMEYFHNPTDGNIATFDAIKTTFVVSGDKLSKVVENLYSVSYGPDKGNIINDITGYNKIMANTDLNSLGNLYDINYLKSIENIINPTTPKIVADNTMLLNSIIRHLDETYPGGIKDEDLENEIMSILEAFAKLSSNKDDIIKISDYFNDYDNFAYSLLKRWLNRGLYKKDAVNDKDLPDNSIDDIVGIIIDSFTNNTKIDTTFNSTDLRDGYSSIDTDFLPYYINIGNNHYYFRDLRGLTEAQLDQLKQLIDKSDTEQDIIDGILDLNFSVSLRTLNPDTKKINDRIFTFSTDMKLHSSTDADIIEDVYQDDIFKFELKEYIDDNTVPIVEREELMNKFKKELESKSLTDDITYADINSLGLSVEENTRLKYYALASKLLSTEYYNPLIYFELRDIYNNANDSFKKESDIKSSFEIIEKIYTTDDTSSDILLSKSELRYKDKLKSDTTVDPNYDTVLEDKNIKQAATSLDFTSHIDYHIHIFNDKYKVIKENGVYEIYEISKSGDVKMTGLNDVNKKEIINYLTLTSIKVEKLNYTVDPTKSAIDNDIIQTIEQTIVKKDNVTYGTKGDIGENKNEDAVYVNEETGDYIVTDGVGGSNIFFLKANFISKEVIKHLLGYNSVLDKDNKMLLDIANIALKDYDIKDPDRNAKALDKILAYLNLSYTPQQKNILLMYSMPQIMFNLRGITKVGTDDVKHAYSSTTFVKAKKLKNNVYNIKQVGDAVWAIIDKNGNIKKSAGLSAVNATYAIGISIIKDGFKLTGTNSIQEYEITLEEGDRLLLSSDFLQKEQDILDFIKTIDNDNVDLASYQRAHKEDDSTFIIIKYVKSSSQSQLDALPKAGFQTFNKPVYTKKEISNYVAGPLLKASEIFWDKNIQTTGSWVPSLQDPKGSTNVNYIEIAFDSLSEANKKIALELGEGIGEFGGIRNVRIVIAEKDSTLEDIQKKSIEIANKFKSQDLLWYSPTTLQDVIDSLKKQSERNPAITKQVNEEIKRVTTTWGKELKTGQYFDKATQTIWDSEELYRKFKGLPEIQTTTQSELDAKIADIEKRRQLSLSSKEEVYEGGLGVTLKATIVDKDGNKSPIQLSGDKNDLNRFEELEKRINDMYDIQYLTEISNGTMTAVDALQSLKEVGRENGDVYRQLEQQLNPSLVYPISILGEIIQHHDNDALLVTDENIQYGTVKKTNDQTNKNSIYIDKDAGIYAIADVNYLLFMNSSLKMTPEELSKSIIQYLVSNGRKSPDINKITTLPNGELMLSEIERESGTIVKKIGENSYILDRLNNTGNAVIADKNWNIKIVDRDDITLGRDETLIIVEGNFNNNDEIISFVESIIDEDLSQYDDYSFIIIDYDETNLDDDTKIKNTFERTHDEQEKQLSVIEKDGNQYIIYIDDENTPDIYDNKRDAEEALKNINKDVNKSLLLVRMLINNNVDLISLLKNGFIDIDEIIAALESYKTGSNSLIDDYINNIINTIQQVEPIKTDAEVVNKLREYISRNNLQLTIIDNKLFPIEVEFRPDDGYYFNNVKVDVREIEVDEYFSNVVENHFYYIDLNSVLSDSDTLYKMFTTIYMRQSRTDQTRNLNLSMTNALIDTLNIDIKKEFATRYLETLSTDTRSDTNYIAYIKDGDSFTVRSTIDTNYSTKLKKVTLNNSKYKFQYKPNSETNQQITITAEAIAKGNIKIFEGKVKSPFGIGFTGKKIKDTTKYSGKLIHFSTLNSSESVLLYTVISDGIEYEITATKENSVVTLKELPFLLKSTPTHYMIYTIHNHTDNGKTRNKPITIYAVPPYLNLFLYENNDFIKDFESFIENENKINLIDFFTLIYTNAPSFTSKSQINDNLYANLLKELTTLSKLISDYTGNFKSNLVNAYLQVFNYNMLLMQDQRYLSMFDGKFIYDNNSKKYIVNNIAVGGDEFFELLSKHMYEQLNTLDNEKTIFEWFKENGNILLDDIKDLTEEKEEEENDLGIGIDDDSFNKTVEEFESDLNLESGLKLNTSNAVANSHVVQGTLATNYFKSYTSIFGQVTVKDNVFIQRRDSVRDLLEGKLLTPGIPTEVNISLETTTNIDIRSLDNNLLNLNTKEDYRTELEKIFDIKKNDLKYLYEKGILELMYMNDIVINDEGQLVLTINDAHVNELSTAITPTERYELIIAYFNEKYLNNTDINEKEKITKIAKNIFVISKTQFIVNTTDNKYLGYVHDLEYLLNEKRSISYFDNRFNKKNPIDLLHNEVNYVKAGFEFLAKVYYEHKNNFTKSYDMTLRNYGKLNTVTKPMVSSLASFRKTDNLTFYQTTVEKEDNMFGIKLISFSDDAHLTNLYDNPEIDTLFYIFNVLAPMINETAEVTNKNKDEAWQTSLINIIKPILENDGKMGVFDDGRNGYNIIEAYTDPKLLTIEQKKFIEDKIIRSRWKSITNGETDYGYINSVYLVKIVNPFETNRIVPDKKDESKPGKTISSSRFFNIGNTTLNKLLDNMAENYDKISSNDPVENANIKTHIKNVEDYLQHFKETIINHTLDLLKHIDSPDYRLNFLLEKPGNTSTIIEKANLLRRIFKMTAIGGESFEATNSTKSVAQSLAKTNTETIGTFYLKYIDKSNGTMFLAVKKNGFVEVLNINNKKLYTYPVVNKTVGPPVVKELKEDVEFEEKIKELLNDVYLNLSYTEQNLSLHSNLVGTNVEIKNYKDLLKVITKTNINGISGHYFINPILSIKDRRASNEIEINVNAAPSTNITSNPKTFKEYFIEKFGNIKELIESLGDYADRAINEKAINDDIQAYESMGLRLDIKGALLNNLESYIKHC